HACGTLVTLIWVTLPLLSTFRVAVSDDDVQPLTVALSAPSFPVLRPRLAAEATPTDRSAAVSAIPKVLVSRFTPHHLPTGSERGAETGAPPVTAGTETLPTRRRPRCRGRGSRRRSATSRCSQSCPTRGACPSSPRRPL